MSDQIERTERNPAPDSIPVSYRVQVLPEQHELNIEMTLVGAAAEGTVRLEVPTWVPGDYAFMPFARDLFDFKVEDICTGKPLTLSRDGWQAFSVKGTGALRISYRAYAYVADFAEPCGVVDHTYAILLGGRYLRTPAWVGPCSVEYEFPAGWKIHHAAGATRVGQTTVWNYPSHEVLLDSPVVMGGFDLIQRSVKGTEFSFAFVDRTLGYEAGVETLVDNIVKVSVRCYEMFGSFPFSEYTFVLSFNPTADWGLEHLTSSMCGLGPEVFIDDSQMAYATRVCAHELFHAWNVRRLRPAPLKHLDLYSGSFTEGLWLAEGFTRYYEFLFCARAGIYSWEQFFSTIVNYHRHLVAIPACRRVPVVDSSLATYLNHNKYPGRCNNSIDYYDKEMLIAFELDAELRQKEPPDSLDSALRAFYERYLNNAAGYTTDDA